MTRDDGAAGEVTATPDPPADDGVWDLTLGGLLVPLALTLDGRPMPVLVLAAVPVIAGLVRWTVTRPRIGREGLRRQLEALKLGPMGLLCGLVLLGALVIGAMARNPREVFEPARTAAPGVAAAAVLALGLIAVLLSGRLRSPRFLVWGGLCLVSLLLEPVATSGVRTWALLVLGGAIVATGGWQLWRFLGRSSSPGPDAPPGSGRPSPASRMPRP